MAIEKIKILGAVLEIQWNLDLRKPDLRKNLDLRKIVGTTNFLVHTLLCEMAVEIIGKSFVTFVYRTFL